MLETIRPLHTVCNQGKMQSKIVWHTQSVLTGKYQEEKRSPYEDSCNLYPRYNIMQAMLYTKTNRSLTVGHTQSILTGKYQEEKRSL